MLSRIRSQLTAAILLLVPLAASAGDVMMTGPTNTNSVTAGYAPPYFNTSQFGATAEGITNTPMAVAETATAMYCHADVDPGNTKTYVIQVRQNNANATGVACTITGNGANGQDCNATGLSVAFAAGDYIDFQYTPSGSPTSTRIGCGLYLTTASGVTTFIVFDLGGFSTSNSAVRYFPPGSGGNSQSATFIGDPAPVAMTAVGLTCLWTGTAGSGASYTAALNIGGTDSSLGSCSISGTSGTTCAVTGSVAINAADLLAISMTPSGTPTARSFTCSVKVTIP